MSATGLLSLFGWSFLPKLVTGYIQSIYYAITIRAGDPKPQPGTPRWAEHRRRIHILVVTVYLLYTIYEADYELRRAGSYYDTLSVPLDATEREIKSRFRRLAALFHPDKVVGAAGRAGADVDDANSYFVHLKTANDVLTDPVRRFAYERFGPAAVLEWQHCSSVRDYVYRGLMLLLPYYGIAAASMYGLGLLGYLTWGIYERWVVMVLLLLFEYTAVTRPARPALLESVVNPLLRLVAPGRAPYLPFQAIALARKLSVTIYIAFSQIGPMLMADTKSGNIVFGGQQKGGGAASQEKLLNENIDRLADAAKGLDVETQRLLELEMVPYVGDEETLTRMRGKVKEWLVQNTIRSDPIVRDALGRSFQKRRVDAPAGARGTK